jgi:hypothetical protein
MLGSTTHGLLSWETLFGLTGGKHRVICECGWATPGDWKSPKRDLEQVELLRLHVISTWAAKA